MVPGLHVLFLDKTFTLCVGSLPNVLCLSNVLIYTIGSFKEHQLKVELDCYHLFLF